MGEDLQWRVVAGLDKLLLHDHVGLGVGVQVGNIVEDLGRALSSTNHRNLDWRAAVRQQLGNQVCVLRGVDDHGVLLRQRLRDRRLAANGENDIACAVCAESASLGVPLHDSERLDTVLLNGRHRYDFAVVPHHIVKVACAPPQVVLVLGSRRQESVQVDEVQHPSVLVDVVEECEVRSGVTQRCHVLEEGNLHLGAGQQHTSVPSEPGLLLEEENIGSLLQGASLQIVMKGHSNGKRSRTKTSADEVMDGIQIRRLQVAGAVDVVGNVRSAVDTVRVAGVVDSRGTGKAIVAIKLTVRCHFERYLGGSDNKHKKKKN